jgi:hypothetical protein
MNKELIQQFLNQACYDEQDQRELEDWINLEKFAELIIRESNQAVLEVPVYYKDYRSQIEEATIRDCARAVLEKFGVEQ